MKRNVFKTLLPLIFLLFVGCGSFTLSRVPESSAAGLDITDSSESLESAYPGPQTPTNESAPIIEDATEPIVEQAFSPIEPIVEHQVPNPAGFNDPYPGPEVVKIFSSAMGSRPEYQLAYVTNTDQEKRQLMLEPNDESLVLSELKIDSPLVLDSRGEELSADGNAWIRAITLRGETGWVQKDVVQMGTHIFPDQQTELQYISLAALMAINPSVSDFDQSWFQGINYCDWVGVTCEMGQVTELDLSNRLIHRIPAEIKDLTELKALDLSGNMQLRTLPSEIGELKNLEVLTLVSSQPVSLPFEISKLTNLKHLALSGVIASELPPQLWALHSLETLDLSRNGSSVSVIPPEVKNLTNLRDLHLNGNQIQLLPAEIGSLESLEVLSLVDNNLQLLPGEIGQLKNLKELYLSSNRITELPREIGGLVNLVKLDLMRNQISALPEEIGSLRGLRELNLYANNLQYLPSSIQSLKQLRRLDAGGNQLLELPTEIGSVTKLGYLDLRDNSIQSLPMDFENLDELGFLYLNDNQISEFPEVIAGLKLLKTLSLSGNPIIGQIPESWLALHLDELFFTPLFFNPELDGESLMDVCFPAANEYQAWKAAIPEYSGPDTICP